MGTTTHGRGQQTGVTCTAVRVDPKHLLTSDLDVCFPVNHPQALGGADSSGGAVWVERSQHMAPVPLRLWSPCFPPLFAEPISSVCFEVSVMSEPGLTPVSAPDLGSLLAEWLP